MKIDWAHDVPLPDQAIELLGDGDTEGASATALAAIANELRTANLIALAGVMVATNASRVDLLVAQVKERLGLSGSAG